jgi:hypothetical protein
VAVFVTKEFGRFRRKAKLSGLELHEAAEQVRRGRWDADLGAGIFKQRIARKGEGKSGGYRTILCFKRGSHMFFIHGFAKSEKENVAQSELHALKRLSKVLLNLSDEQINASLRSRELVKVVENGGG